MSVLLTAFISPELKLAGIARGWSGGGSGNLTLPDLSEEVAKKGHGGGPGPPKPRALKELTHSGSYDWGAADRWEVSKPRPRSSGDPPSPDPLAGSCGSRSRGASSAAELPGSPVVA